MFYFPEGDRHADGVGVAMSENGGRVEMRYLRDCAVGRLARSPGRRPSLRPGGASCSSRLQSRPTCVAAMCRTFGFPRSHSLPSPRDACDLLGSPPSQPRLPAGVVDVRRVTGVGCHTLARSASARCFRSVRYGSCCLFTRAEAKSSALLLSRGGVRD